MNYGSKTVSAAGKFLRGIVSTLGYRIGGLIREPYSGAWQRNGETYDYKAETYYAVFACMTLIAGDISKLPITVQREGDDDIWEKVKGGPLNEFIRRPNEYQTKNQFIENWILSKLLYGNTYVLKVRDAEGNVIGGKILDPTYVTVMVSDLGNVYYQLATDTLAQVSTDNVTVPASEVVHDRFNCLYHPLVGLSPIYAAALAANQGLAMQNNTLKLFSNGGQSPGILTAPGQIAQADADRIKEHWEANYGGTNNAGKVAVLGSGLTFKSSSITSVDAQLIEQLRWTAEVVCGTFHVPPYMVGIGSVPNASNVQALILQYYAQCLQVLIEAMETCLDQMFDQEEGEGFEVDIEALLRMDGTAMAEYLKTLREAAIITINEGRKRLGLKPVDGGNSVYLQQQNFSLEALVKRDAGSDPFATTTTTNTNAANADEGETPEEIGAKSALFEAFVKDKVGGMKIETK